MLSVLSTVFNHARRNWKGCEGVENPLRKALERGSLPPANDARDRVASEAEWRAVLSALEETEQATRCALIFLRWTAARRSEAVRLDWEDLDWSDEKRGVVMATFRGTKDPRGRLRSRSALVAAEAVSALRLFGRAEVKRRHLSKSVILPNGMPKSGPVFSTSSGARLRGDSLTQAWSRARARAGLKDIEGLRVHDLRHTRTTEITKHLPAIDAMRMTGHSDPRTLARYYHPTASETAFKFVSAERNARSKQRKGRAGKDG